MEQDFEAPPMGAENLPIKEMKTEQTSHEIEARKIKKSKQFKILAGLTVIIAVLGGIMVGLMIKQRNGQQVEPLPSPVAFSPTPAPVASEIPYTLKQRIEEFEVKMENLDLQESVLNPPSVDFDIRFRVKD
jgi:hypothetical protein